MERIAFLIIAIFCLKFSIQYFIELKEEITLRISLIFMSLSFAIVAIKYIIPIPLLILFGHLFFVISLLVFIIHLLKNRFFDKYPLYYRTMFFTTILVFLRYLFKLNHFPAVGLFNILLIIPMIFGLIITLKEKQLIENKPFNLIMAIVVIDFLRFVHGFLYPLIFFIRPIID